MKQVSAIIAIVSILALAACTVSVDKRVGVYFEEGSTPTFHPLNLPGGAPGESAEPNVATNLASASATAQDADAHGQWGYFNFRTTHESDTKSDLQQAIESGLQANVPVSTAGGRSEVTSTTSDTGGATTNADPESDEPDDPEPDDTE